jgi:hypothetical protein
MSYTQLLIDCEEDRILRAVFVRSLVSQTDGTGAIPPPFRLMPAGCSIGMGRSTFPAASGSPHRTEPGRTRASP